MMSVDGWLRQGFSLAGGFGKSPSLRPAALFIQFEEANPRDTHTGTVTRNGKALFLHGAS